MLTLANTPPLRPIDPICLAFDVAWSDGKRPRIEDYLSAVAETLREDLQRELIQQELEWRCRLGEQPLVADYAMRFPSSVADLAAWLDEAECAATELRKENTNVNLGVSDVPPTRTDDSPLVKPIYKPGDRIGVYELRETLGQGGMGDVWKAYHHKLEKIVAFKLNRDRRTAERFLREMQFIGKLDDHPNLVKALDANEIDGALYLAMDLVEGIDLSKWVKEHAPIPIHQVMAIAIQIATGLAYLHRKGIVHRDLKPANLILTPDNTIKIVDLGLAGRIDATDDGSKLTLPGPMGTPEYIAPEQIRNAASVNGQADMYGLGGTLFHLLIGRAPFADHKGIDAKFHAHQYDPAPDVSKERPDIPPVLAELVNGLLAKYPSERPTAARVLEMLMPEKHPKATEVFDKLMAEKRSKNEPEESGKLMPAGRWRRILPICGGVAAMVTIAVTLSLGGKPATTNDTKRELPPVLANYKQTTTNDVRRERSPVLVNDKLRVLKMDVHHFANVTGFDDKGFDRKHSLLMGTSSFDTRLNDTVTFEAKLSEMAYAYLIAFCADGTDELCYPEKEDVVFTKTTDNPRYPPEGSDKMPRYRLEKDVGMHVFVVVVSSKQLPSYRDWRAKRTASPWKPNTVSPMGVVWYDDGSGVEALTVENPLGRGKGKEIADQTPVGRLTEWLRKDEADTVVTAIGFRVGPKAKP